MFILEKPYVSEYLIDTLVQDGWDILYNESIAEANIEEGAFELVSAEDAVNYYQKQEFPIIYSNSENAINWVLENLPQSNTASYIKLFKDKAKFREILTKLYPDFFYRAENIDGLDSIDLNEIKFPVVVKPAVGFLSLGVHTITEKSRWNDTITKLNNEMKQFKTMYPEVVINDSKFIVEEFIDGEEYAIDAYYDRNGEPVILNIFEHPRKDESDVKDRIYITSTEIMIRYMAKFGMMLRDVGKLVNVKNFPVHVEVRVTNDGRIIPIEFNPMRFAGWCTTDIAHYAWGINVYEYFQLQKRPDWNEILMNTENKIYYFSMVEVPDDIKRGQISGFNYEEFLTNYSNILELRRINPRENPLFAIIFGSTTDKQEIRKILEIDVKDYII